jgi:flagellar hook-length control protein FliK
MATNLEVSQPSHKSRIEAINLEKGPNFQDILNIQTKFKLQNDKSTLGNVDSSTQSKVSKKVDRSEHTEKKPSSSKHEKTTTTSYETSAGGISVTPLVDNSKSAQNSEQNQLAQESDGLDMPKIGSAVKSDLTSTNFPDSVANIQTASFNDLSGLNGNAELNFTLTTKLVNSTEENLVSQTELQAPIQVTASSNLSSTSPLATTSMASANAPYPNSANWQHEVSQKIIWMKNGENQSATLTFNSQELGPLKVVIHVNNAQADANFTADNPQLRQALEDGMSHLREMMKQSGIELGQTNINSNSDQNNQKFKSSDPSQQRVKSNDLHIDQISLLTSSMKISDSLVNTFA